MPKLTDRFLAALKIEHGRKDRLVFDTACRGLGVRRTAKGTRTFLVQWTDPATRRKMREPLGVWGGITIEQAREAARARLGEVAKGIDPKAERVRRQAEAERERAETALTLDALVSECQPAGNFDPRSASNRDPFSGLVQACPGSEQEGPARVA